MINENDNKQIDEDFESKINAWKISNERQSEHINNLSNTKQLDANLLERTVLDSTKQSIISEKKKEIGYSKMIKAKDPIQSDGWSFFEIDVNDEEPKAQEINGGLPIESTPVAIPVSKNEQIPSNGFILKTNSNISNQCKQAGPGESLFPKIMKVNDDRYNSSNSETIENVSSEIIAHLEKKIQLLNTQLENYQKTIVAKDKIIQQLMENREVLEENVNLEKTSHDLLILANKGLSLITEIQSMDPPKNYTVENNNLKIDNFYLKNMIEELSGKLKIQKIYQNNI